MLRSVLAVLRDVVLILGVLLLLWFSYVSLAYGFMAPPWPWAISAMLMAVAVTGIRLRCRRARSLHRS